MPWLEDKKATTVAGQPTGDTTESGNPTHNADGTFGSDGMKKNEQIKSINNNFQEFIDTFDLEEDFGLDDFDLDSYVEYKNVEEMSTAELAVEIKSHREFLSNYFDLSEFGTNAFNRDLRLQCSNFRQLKMLVEKYPFETIGKPKLQMNGRLSRANARTCLSRFNNKMVVRFIDFNSSDFQTYEKIKYKIYQDTTNNWAMPCGKDNYSNYSLSHEYGHLLTAEIMNRKGVSTFEISAFESRIARQIMNIYEEQNNYSSNYRLDISEYGKSSPAEFFAECFANLNCGKPNPLGKAMETWLKQYGGY